MFLVGRMSISSIGCRRQRLYANLEPADLVPTLLRTNSHRIALLSLGTHQISSSTYTSFIHLRKSANQVKRRLTTPDSVPMSSGWV